MTGQVAKWGNSLAVRLPKAMAQTLELHPGSEVVVELDHGRIVIAPAKPQFDLKTLLRGMHANNTHQSVDWGERMGREVW